MSNFIVSARKYRPVTFTSVVGQGHITSTLKNAIARGQLAHAYLFCGPRGVGKTTCARIFAKAINCLSPAENEACGSCESCLSFDQGRSFNIHELDAASNNSVDDIRSLTDQVRIPPQIGKYSLYIIDEVHMLSSAAFNAFLKTLEEPPAHAIFILATTEKHKIIPTILSRCQIFDFNRIRVEDGVFYLKFIAEKEGIVVDDESLHLIAQKADGGMRDALSMFDKAVSFCGTSLDFKSVATTLNVLDYDTYFGAMKAITDGDYKVLLTTFDHILKSGFSGQIFINGLNTHMRDLLMCKDEKTLPLLEVSGSVLERYRTQSQECDTSLLFNGISVLTALDGTLRNSSNQRLSVELGLMKLCGLGQKKNELVTSADKFVCFSAYPLAELSTNNAPKPIAQAAIEQKIEKREETEKIDPPAPVPQTKSVEAKGMETKPRVSISGSSISSLLSRTEIAADQAEVAQEIIIDPMSEEKVETVKDRFVTSLKREDPRLALAFSSMVIEQNRITVYVPNEISKQEIERTQTELLYSLATMAKVNGSLELTVNIKESDAPLRPIKVEDKLRYLIERNSIVLDLKQLLDLDIE